MKRHVLVNFSVSHPRLVVFFTVLLSLVALSQFPKVKIDTNPKHMLPTTSDVRVWNDEVDRTFALYEDTMVVGVTHEAGVLNQESLGKIFRITGEILKINGVAARDVNTFSTITNVTADGAMLMVAPLMPEIPKNKTEIDSLKKELFENPLFVDHILSKDGKTAALSVPLEKGANGKEIADKIREITRREGGPEKYFIAGDPVARDTFGAEMFKLM